MPSSCVVGEPLRSNFEALDNYFFWSGPFEIAASLAAFLFIMQQ